MLLLLILVSLLQMNSATFSLQQKLTQNRQKHSSAARRRPSSREDAYRANNLGVALLEQFKYREGAEEFKRALRLDPQLKLARTNLSIALYNVPDMESALREARAAAALDTNAPQPHYMLGLIARSQNRTEDAIREFRRVLELDKQDTGANVNLGQLLAQQKNYAEAIKAFRTALAVEPYNLTALYNLAINLTRTNERAEGQRLLQKFQELRTSGAGTTIGTNYLEQGRYAEAVASTGAESELVSRTTPLATFKDATASMLPDNIKARTVLIEDITRGSDSSNVASGDLESVRREIAARPGGNIALFDYDGDVDLDLFVVTPTEQRLYRNDDGKFVDVTKSAGALAEKLKGIGTCAVAGDYDNDGKPDLFVMRYGSASLYHNDGNGKFSDVTGAANIPAYPYLSASIAFVDVDHDGDLDIFIAGLADLSKLAGNSDTISLYDLAGAPNMLLRNDGNGKFTDITDTAKVKGQLHHAVAVVPTDFNNRRDVDLLVVNYDAPPDLFSNQRDGTFRNVGMEVGLDVVGNWTCVAAGDVNKDGFTDFFFGQDNAQGLFAMSDGKGRFKTFRAPAVTGHANAAQFMDYDNDGLLDCVILTSSGLRVLRNVGDGWIDVSRRAVARSLFEDEGLRDALTRRIFASGDMDGDGDTDFVFGSRSSLLTVARNDGGNLNHSIRVNLQGRVSNKSGIEAKIEVRAGSLVQKLETYAASPAPAPADAVFGLGQRSAPDAVRILWPSGVVQSEIEFTNNQTASARQSKSTALTLPVTELDRKPSSCPYLYTWNGERFEFVTDFMGGGEMGYLEEPGRRNTPDPDEYVRIRADQLKERDGFYEIRVTDELEETLYADKFQLIAVSHPQGVEVYPNEGMIDPPLPPFKLYATQGAHAPLGATDDQGQDVLARVSKLDRQYPDNFKLQKIRGYSDEHTLTLKLDTDGANRKRTLLLLTGWTDYAWSSDNVAASQSGRSIRLPALQVKNRAGEWQTVIEDIGIPVGRPQTVTVDLTGKFLSASREVRIITNMRIYWDQILVDTSDGNFQTELKRLDPVRADLRYRGFSKEITPDGREPYGYDYARVSSVSPWKVMAGRYTREGDVLELLRNSDDMFAISRPGDEISLSFDARALPPLPSGWTRTFLLYADGFSKEMDINSASPDTVAPLPFHGMKSYPYSAPEHYPLTEERRAYMEKYNTRIIASQVPTIESVLLERK